MFIKKITKKILDLFFGAASTIILTRYKLLFKKLTGGYFSLNKLDRQLEKYVDYDDGFFVELGANDGVSQSNSLYFELNRNWRGVLVEPTPHNFSLCKANRGSSNHIFCNACVSFEYSKKYVDIEYADLMTISQNLDLDLEDKKMHIKKGKKLLNSHEVNFSFGANAATLNSLLEISNAPKIIDFLSLDVEGAELEVLKGINFEQFSFKFMLIEVRDFDRVAAFLKKNGYKFEKKFSSNDYLFKKI